MSGSGRANGLSTLLPRLRIALADLDPAQAPAAWLGLLVRQRLDLLPQPGSGATLLRWQALSEVAGHDLSLAKLYEGHTDALAVQAEVDPSTGFIAGASWGMWAAEAADGRSIIETTEGSRVSLQGAKRWCSGAGHVSHGLMTAWHADGRGPQLVRVVMDQLGVSVSGRDWHAVGMSGSASLDIAFHGAVGHVVGTPGAYLRRPGFWQGGAGIAACWFGGARALAGSLRQSLLQGPTAGHSALRLAALGKVDMSLTRTAALLREAAHWIDAHPAEDAAAVALRVRLAAEDSARLVLDEAGRALGATPFCRDARFARAAADLPVFVRQSHADRDFAALGEKVLEPGEAAWPL